MCALGHSLTLESELGMVRARCELELNERNLVITRRIAKPFLLLRLPTI